MKQIIILGANGATAKEITRQLLTQQDMHLTLFLRNANRLPKITDNRIAVFEGDARDLSALKKSIMGQDIVISTLGGMDLAEKTENIVNAMEQVGCKRIIAISAGGIYNELPEPFNTWDNQIVGQTRPVNLKMAEIIERSSLQYTILRPVWLTNKPIQDIQLTHKGEIYKGTETSRTSIGKFIANIVKDPALYINENLGISQPNTEGDKPAAYL